MKTWIALLAVASFAAAAQAPIPPLKARVTDQTSTLTPEQKAGLEETLRAFETRKGAQIAVLMVSSTGSEAMEQYALRVAEQWKIGRKDVDDGAILVIAKDDRALRIEVGYGLEGALNDATSKRIVSEVIVPRFREGDFYGGITAGVDRMIRVIDGEALPAPARPQGSPASGGGVAQYFPLLLIGALVIGGFMRAILGRFMGSVATGGIVGFLVWMLAGALFMAVIAGAVGFFFTLVGGGARRRSAWSPAGWGGRGGLGGGWGGGGFGGGGGGFGGGGGGFGGGGASGRW